ncbi:MAG: hypothetical protein ACYSWW_18970, partial [Planctomycetota bacterium]
LKLMQKVLVVCYSRKILFLALMANRTTFLCKTNCDTACKLKASSERSRTGLVDAGAINEFAQKDVVGVDQAVLAVVVVRQL